MGCAPLEARKRDVRCGGIVGHPAWARSGNRIRSTLEGLLAPPADHEPGSGRVQRVDQATAFFPIPRNRRCSDSARRPVVRDTAERPLRGRTRARAIQRTAGDNVQPSSGAAMVNAGRWWEPSRSGPRLRRRWILSLVVVRSCSTALDGSIDLGSPGEAPAKPPAKRPSRESRIPRADAINVSR